MSDDQCVALLKQWALAGYEISADAADGRQAHVHGAGDLRRTFDPFVSEAELDRRLAAAQAADT